MIKLNLGCGALHKPKNEGWVNVDKYPPADFIWDLEAHHYRTVGKTKSVFEKKYEPWPWKDSEIDEVLFNHSLEHMGETVDGFFHIIKELYRVCKNGALVTLVVPHPRHDDFLNDPTHVRVITPTMIGLLSKESNDHWAKQGKSNTPLAHQLGVDFVIQKRTGFLEDKYMSLPAEVIQDAIETRNNILKQYLIEMKCVK